MQEGEGRGELGEKGDGAGWLPHAGHQSPNGVRREATQDTGTQASEEDATPEGHPGMRCPNHTD